MRSGEEQAGLKVLHLTDMYMATTQNWLYPQIVGVPGIESAVCCRKVTNLATYPLNGRPIFMHGNEDLERTRGFGRVLRALVWRLRALIAWGRAYCWRPALFHAHFGTRGWEALRLKQLFGVPLITSFYGTDAWALPVERPEWRQRFQSLFQQGDLFLVEGPAMRQRLVELGCSMSKVRICRIGVNIAELQWNQPSFEDGLKIVMVGRFVEKKGLIDGLQSCAMAAARGVPLTVTIVGDSGEDSAGQQIKQALVELSETPDLAGRVKFTGYISHLETKALLATHNVFLCPSRHATSGDAEGGLPVILVEAMAMGLVAIGSRHCDIPEAIQHGRTGILVEEKSIPEIADALQRLSLGTIDTAASAIAARQRIVDHFDQQKQLQALGKIYREVAGRPIGAAP